MRFNLLRGHGGTTGYHYLKGCRCPPCVAANSERFLLWERQNPEKKRCRDHRYYANLSEEKLAVRRERSRAGYSRRYEAKQEAECERRRRYYRAHIEQELLRVKAREARRYAATGSLTSSDVRRQYAAQQGACYYCSANVGDSYHVDHAIPLSRGGSNDPSNIVISCPRCNLRKGAKLPHEFDAGRLC